jgi:hypothetical protein
MGQNNLEYGMNEDEEEWAEWRANLVGVGRGSGKSRPIGLDALLREIGIYSSKGQLYEPVDKKSLLYYRFA